MNHQGHEVTRRGLCLRLPLKFLPRQPISPVRGNLHGQGSASSGHTQSSGERSKPGCDKSSAETTRQTTTGAGHRQVKPYQGRGSRPQVVWVSVVSRQSSVVSLQSSVVSLQSSVFSRQSSGRQRLRLTTDDRRLTTVFSSRPEAWRRRNLRPGCSSPQTCAPGLKQSSAIRYRPREISGPPG